MEYSKKKGGLGAAAAFIAGAATTAAVGGYLLYGPKGKRNRTKLDFWVAKAEADILEKMEASANMTLREYGKLVEKVMDKYELLYRLGKAKRREVAEDFKRRFRELKEEAERARDEAEVDLALEEKGEKD